MIRNNKTLLLLLALSGLVFDGLSQNITLEKALYGAADDLYLTINNAKTNDTLILKNEINGLTTRTAISNSATDVLFYAGSFRQPGLHRFTWEFRHGTLLANGVYNVYAYSGRQLQIPGSPSKGSILNTTCDSGCNEIKAAVFKTDSALRLAFKSIKTDNSIIRSINPPDTIHYNVDTLQARLNAIANFYSLNIDSGSVKEATYIIGFSDDITIIAHPDSINLGTVRLYADSLLTSLATQLKKDKVLDDDNDFNDQIELWLNKSDTTVPHDTLLYFKREDNFITRDLLRVYAKTFAETASSFWIGYDEHYPDRLLILFRLIGKKHKEKT